MRDDSFARILICDDEEGVRESLKLILEGDYDLSFASDGIEALEQVKNSSFDLVILDVKMPRMGGLEALANIKKINPKVRAILISAYKLSDKVDAKFIEKPFAADVVLRTVKEAIEKN